MGKNLLFVCKYNRFRSKVAEALFNKYNKDKRIKVKSAGIIKGAAINYKQKRICKKKGLIIKDPTTGISTKLLKWQDILIIVADDVPASLFKNNKKYNKKLIVWKIKDAISGDEKEGFKIIRRIEDKIIKLVRKLNAK